jgi:hypothetical protein
MAEQITELFLMWSAYSGRRHGQYYETPVDRQNQHFLCLPAYTEVATPKPALQLARGTSASMFARYGKKMGMAKI